MDNVQWGPSLATIGCPTPVIWNSRGRGRSPYLDSGHVALQSDDLSHQLVVADTHQLEHSRAGHVLSRDHCTAGADGVSQAAGQGTGVL